MDKIQKNIDEFKRLSNELKANLKDENKINKVINKLKKENQKFNQNFNLSFKPKPSKKESETIESLKVNNFAKISNIFFRKISEKLVDSFKDVDLSLKKANIPILIQSYISMMLFSLTLGFLLSSILFIFLVSTSLISWSYFWIPLAVCVLIFAGFYSYPGSEASNIQKEIAYELPFATIHMATIAGSDIEPTKIFKIIATSDEYKNLGKELKKILVQINVYGYDLVNSLKNISKRTSNEKLAELLGGLATNISGGGSLKNYLEKKSENYLQDYKLERKQYINVAETFMDIYISVLIAAPLILMLMFIIMSVANLNLGGLSLRALLFLTVAIVGIMNVVFLIVLSLKQPKI